MFKHSPSVHTVARCRALHLSCLSSSALKFWLVICSLWLLAFWMCSFASQKCLVGWYWSINWRNRAGPGKMCSQSSKATPIAQRVDKRHISIWYDYSRASYEKVCILPATRDSDASTTTLPMWVLLETASQRSHTAALRCVIVTFASIVHFLSCSAQVFHIG